MVRQILILFGVCFCLTSIAFAQSREQKVRGDKTKFEAAGFWIYNDLAQAQAEAKKTGRPLLVVLRCIPCEQCVKLDDELVEQDENLRPLLEKFVRVRIVSANGLDLSTFQFDTDQSFAVFMLNADGAIYGRYGTRSDQSLYADDVSIEGLTKALEGALALHAAYPANKAELALKRGPKSKIAEVPENLPTLKGKFGSAIDYEGNVVKSCIHCHQIGDAIKQHQRDTTGALPDTILFPYPHPKSLGLILSPRERALVLRVDAGSLAEKAGFRAGDEITKIAGQTPLSIADVQWVLQQTPATGGAIAATVKRDDKTADVQLTLPAGWRQLDDIAWRASTWELRRIALGGLYLKKITPEQQAEAKVPAGSIALKVQHVGQYPPHDGAKRAGFKVGDIILSFDGQTDLMRETDLLEYALNDLKPESSVPVVVLSDGQKTTLTLKIGK